MDELEIDVVAEVELDDPVLFEGLPGVGHVGTLAVEHLLEELEGESTLVRQIYSREFPPQVSIEDGVSELTCAELHAVEVPEGRDLLLLTGDHQAQSNAGHYTLLEGLEDVGVEFRDDEPAGGIVGVSGLLLGLGERRGFDAACLMGETSGYLVDPKSARSVLEVLADILGFDLDYESLDERADEMEDVIGKIQEMEQQQSMDVPTDDDLRYIG